MKLFVYGSLMSASEIERVLGRIYSRPLLPHVLCGYRRDWSASENGVAYLNLTADPCSRVTGSVAEVELNDLLRLDAWEMTYERVQIGGLETYICRAEFRNFGAVVSRRYWLLVQSILAQALPQLPCHLAMAD